MNTVEKLFEIVRFKSENPQDPKWLAISSDKKQKINQMYKALDWMKGQEGTADAQREFFAYFEVTDATLIKNVYEELFGK